MFAYMKQPAHRQSKFDSTVDLLAPHSDLDGAVDHSREVRGYGWVMATSGGAEHFLRGFALNYPTEKKNKEILYLSGENRDGLRSTPRM